MATHKVSVTLPDPLEKRFQLQLEAGLKKAAVITRALDAHLPKSKRHRKSK